MRFIQVRFTVGPAVAEFLIAELVEQGYDSFQELDQHLEAYVDEALFLETALNELCIKYADLQSIKFSHSVLEDKNWNEEWEKNFQPVEIGDQCIIRASFHKTEKEYTYDIIINPKMSFGTGHHETTSMMVAQQLELDHKGKTVMDAGSGTGILAIMASKLGASQIDAFDIEDWAFENLKENTALNNCSNILVSKGTVSEVPLSLAHYDIILANINKNVLLAEIPIYAQKLTTDGTLVLSGFYIEDCESIEACCAAAGLSKKGDKEKNKWASLVFSR